MEKDKRVKINDGREALLQPELAERPPLGPPVAEVRFRAPWWPGRTRARVIAFLDALVAAFRIRACDEKDLVVLAEGNRVVVRRTLPDGSCEVRLEREGKGRALLRCDRRELDNLYHLGILAKAEVAWPKGAPAADDHGR